MWSKHQRNFHDHVKYIHNYIVKTFRVRITYHTERLHEMHDLDNDLPQPSIKGEE